MLGIGKSLSLKSHLLPFSLSHLLNKQLRTLRRTVSNSHANQFKLQKHPSFVHRADISNNILIFDVEGYLLKSTSLFPYFMLVAFEAGSLVRALLLFILYPLICLVREEMALKIMVMVTFFGIKKETFKVGRAVLPKYFLEDVGLEAFELLKKGKKTVAVSDLPQVMIESFLAEYLDIDYVSGRELKVVHGYYMGLMENKDNKLILEEIVEKKESNNDVIGISGLNSSLIHQLSSYCKEIYLVSKVDKRKWQQLPRDKFLKPLVFHDGRLAFRPLPLDTIAMFMWISFGVILAITRMAITLSLPYNISTPMLAFCGLRFTLSTPRDSNTTTPEKKPKKGMLYVCNHRTLLDPLCVSFTMKRNITAVTYSLSRFSEIVAPIKTVRLTRNRDHDAKMMKKLLNEGDLVVCPEGTTCREPYLLRFSPLFAEMSDHITPVALNTQVSMFHGTTAAGLKSLDPIFFLMNPSPCYTMQLLGVVPGFSNNILDQAQISSRYEVANHVQREIGQALGFQCTKLTRRDKYLILAGNEGITTDCKKI